MHSLQNRHLHLRYVCRMLNSMQYMNLRGFLLRSQFRTKHRSQQTLRQNLRIFSCLVAAVVQLSVVVVVDQLILQLLFGCIYLLMYVPSTKLSKMHFHFDTCYAGSAHQFRREKAAKMLPAGSPPSNYLSFEPIWAF